MRTYSYIIIATSITVVFDKATNNAGMRAGAYSCRLIFRPATINILGSAKCTWPDASSLNIALQLVGQRANVQINLTFFIGVYC